MDNQGHSLLYTLSPLQIKLRGLLGLMATLNKQFTLDGCRNIWVIKAPESSCGKGIKLFYRLQEILDCEKGMGGRTVQKYLETPLLTSIGPTIGPTEPPHPSSLGLKQSISNSIKFDLRIWVLVTSYAPLEAYIYSNVYGRRCSAVYTNDVSKLFNAYIHLTNYSIQKKQQPSSSKQHDRSLFLSDRTNASKGLLPKISASTRKLRNVCNSFRDVMYVTATQPSLGSQIEKEKEKERSCGTSRSSKVGVNAGVDAPAMSEAELLLCKLKLKLRLNFV